MGKGSMSMDAMRSFVMFSTCVYLSLSLYRTSMMWIRLRISVRRDISVCIGLSNVFRIEPVIKLKKLLVHGSLVGSVVESRSNR